jgi:ABC-type branched-subunit amino acid transport system ATPase component
MPLLEVDDLHVSYGDLEVVSGLSFAIEQGEIITILGSNGAGKTTTLKCLAGLLPGARGRIEFSGHSIANMPAHEIADRGLALVFYSPRCRFRVDALLVVLGSNGFVGADHATDVAKRIVRFSYRTHYCGGVGNVSVRGTADRPVGGAKTFSGSL